MDYYENVDFDQVVFYVNEDVEVEKTTLRELCQEKAEITTTPKGVLPSFHVRGSELWTWGANGNSPYLIMAFDNEDEAEHALLLSFKHDLDTSFVDYYESQADAEAAKAEILADID